MQAIRLSSLQKVQGGSLDSAVRAGRSAIRKIQKKIDKAVSNKSYQVDVRSCFKVSLSAS